MATNAAAPGDVPAMEKRLNSLRMAEKESRLREEAAREKSDRVEKRLSQEAERFNREMQKAADEKSNWKLLEEEYQQQIKLLMESRGMIEDQKMNADRKADKNFKAAQEFKQTITKLETEKKSLEDVKKTLSRQSSKFQSSLDEEKKTTRSLQAVVADLHQKLASSEATVQEQTKALDWRNKGLGAMAFCLLCTLFVLLFLLQSK
uniref:Uncharacterized protein n=1 Tax=Chromera velia CCMP2878 TaxID=1169474 RepID=A0A0G4HYP8_9ALVE|mmetsp:Transcript_17183/g.34837  ORF Transcript_17183/g.34837 Transcript_17183/m.34837 type:complete len:205 (+) Transcript_17183:233-847(+)|eukprot:Cvel_33658.t1-p1 / transcript=Cvel_33658.t1 / gene=Cvel_33658 / organism=Chromera_velia_CCMP2878 / gene_product=Radixin, putative / transcript_product=Radixin, putative / location=Cvel_scaffold5528:800-1411(-) / protein_length=204 / sequence_SO=supercontig / SO=protein_coding / is_pseudo=false